MDKFSLGEEVYYSNKNYRFDNLRCTIIAILESGYILEPVEDRWMFNLYHKSIYANSMGYVSHMPDKFMARIGSRLQSTHYCITVGKRSKNLKPFMKRYDPTQQGDKDDDI
jgi:hypothetical protein